MELLIAILIALGVEVSSATFDQQFQDSHRSEIARAQNIIDLNSYYNAEEGGVVINNDDVAN